MGQFGFCVHSIQPLAQAFGLLAPKSWSTGVGRSSLGLCTSCHPTVRIWSASRGQGRPNHEACLTFLQLLDELVAREQVLRRVDGKIVRFMAINI